MIVNKTNVLSFSVTGVHGVDAIQVIAEEMDRGCGRLTVVCCAESWTAKWLNMGCSLPDFISGVSNDYIIGCFAPSLSCYTDADNSINLRFVKTEIIKRRRARLIDSNKARAMWTEAGDAANVKENCCGYLPGEELPWLFGSEPWHAQWPQVENAEYKYLEKILDAVREGFRHIRQESESGKHQYNTEELEEVSRVTYHEKKYSYHFCAVNGSSEFCGVALVESRILDMEGLQRLKKTICEQLDFDAKAIRSLSFLGEREMSEGFRQLVEESKPVASSVGA